MLSSPDQSKESINSADVLSLLLRISPTMRGKKLEDFLKANLGHVKESQECGQILEDIESLIERLITSHRILGSREELSLL